MSYQKVMFTIEKINNTEIVDQIQNLKLIIKSMNVDFNEKGIIFVILDRIKENQEKTKIIKEILAKIEKEARKYENFFEELHLQDNKKYLSFVDFTYWCKTILYHLENIEKENQKYIFDFSEEKIYNNIDKIQHHYMLLDFVTTF